MLEIEHAIRSEARDCETPGSHIRQEKGTQPKPKFLVQMSSGGVGVFHVKGWGPKSLVCPSKPTKTHFPAEYPDFWQDILVRCFGPYHKLPTPLYIRENGTICPSGK